MSLKFKTLIGLYIFSVLLISGVSKADAVGYQFNKDDFTSPSIGIKISHGKIFELNGNLYFESQDKEALLVHSSNFSFFENVELPIYTEAHSIVTLQGHGFTGALRTIRFLPKSIQQSGLL